MARKRLRPEYVRRNYTYACMLMDPIPQVLWDTARSMQTLWNGLVQQHDQLTKDWDAETSKDVKKAAYEQFWKDAYLHIRDEGERLGLSAWPKWHVYDAFQTAQRAWAKRPLRVGRPKVHHGLRYICIPHRTDSGGVGVDWLFRDSDRKHTAILPETPGHHWRDAYTTIGGERVAMRVLLHRPLPDDGILKRVTLLGTFEPSFGWQWRLQCSVEMPPAQPAPPVGRSMGIDLGWRVSGEGLRIAVVTDGSRCWEWVLPFDLAGCALKRRQRFYARHGRMLETTGNWRTCWDMQAEMDLRLDACKAKLKQEHTAQWPEDARASMTALVKMRAGGLRRLRRVLDDAGIRVTCLNEWYEDYTVRARRLRGAQLRIGRARDDLYRHLADWLARHADVVAWEGDLDLKDMAEASTDSVALKLAQKYRQMASISMLRRFITEALAKRGRTLIDAETAGSTITCTVCGADIAPTAKLQARCAEGHWEDQDVTAAVNIWRDIPIERRATTRVVPHVDRAVLRRGLVRLA